MNSTNRVLAVHNNKSPWELTKDELKNITKPQLLRYWGKQIHLVWDRLPAHLRADTEVALHLPCMEHWNTPHMRIHIDGSAPRRLECEKCRFKVVLMNAVIQE